MNTYRIHTIGPDGTIASVAVAECADDKEVVLKALGEASGCVIEIWDYKRFVAQIPGTAPKEQ